MLIAIMGAMPEEINAIKSETIIEKTETIAGRTYYIGTLENIKIILVFSRWGKTAAAITATTLVTHFKASFILFTGVAGAVSNKLNIGDIVIATALYHHDMDASPLFPQFETPLTYTTFYKPNEFQIKEAHSACDHFVKRLSDEIDNSILMKFSITNPKVFSGIIASGDKFISDTTTSPTLKLPNMRILAVEMEGAAVAQVCHEHKINYCIIRIISDKADSSAHIEFSDFINHISSHYSVGIIRELISSKVFYNSVQHNTALG